MPLTTFFLQVRKGLAYRADAISTFGLIMLYICRSPNRNLARSGIWLGQIGILIWPSQIPDLAKLSLSLARSGIWLNFV